MNERLQLLANRLTDQGLSVNSLPGRRFIFNPAIGNTPEEQFSSKPDSFVDHIEVYFPSKYDATYDESFLSLLDFYKLVLSNVKDVIVVSIWHIGIDKIGEFWTNNLNEIIPFSLLTIVSCETTLNEDAPTG